MDGLREHLLASGADLIGFANITDYAPSCRSGLSFGVSIGLALDPAIVRRIPAGTEIASYGELYDRLNDRLDELCRNTAHWIEQQGYRAVPQTTSYVREHQRGRALMPHKSVAALAGLGWITKSSLLITPQFGSAQRLTSVLTDMPLETKPSSYVCQCGDCTICVDACPAGAIFGKTWERGVDRDELVDMAACRTITEQRGVPYNRTKGTCGICVAVCPHTKEHL